MPQNKGNSAWVITWGKKSNAKPNKAKPFVLNSRLSKEKVRKFVEFLYANTDPEGQLDYAKGNKPLTEGLMNTNFGYVYGENPRLAIRYINSLRVITTKNGETKLDWDEPDLRNHPKNKALKEDEDSRHARQFLHKTDQRSHK